MKAVVFHGVGDIRLDTVRDPRIEQPTDAIVRLTASAICGTDLHMIRGTMPGMVPGTVLGHEGVGVVEEVGRDVKDVRVGDRVVIPSTISCGRCSYCTRGYQSQCDNANPNGSQAGTAFFGGPGTTGPINGLQAELARVPLAGSTLVKLPDEVSDDQAITISDIFPTGYYGADLAEIKAGDSVAVFGCGPVGLFAILSAKLLGAGTVFAIDRLPDRLALAETLGAEPIHFDREHPVEVIRRRTNGIGALRAIDAVGVDAQMPAGGPARATANTQAAEFRREVREVASDGVGTTWWGHWRPGDAPSLALQWAVECLCKAGTLSIVGVYPETMTHFPIGPAMLKNLTLQMGNCPHRHYVPRLVELVRTGRVRPEQVLSNVEPLDNVLDAYKAFDQHQAGWVKVELKPQAAAV